MDKQIVLFGAGECGKQLSQKLLNEHGIQILCFCDNDPKKIGMEINGKKVLSIADAKERYKDFSIIISVYDKNANSDIRGQLADLGYSDCVISYPVNEDTDNQIKFLKCLFPDKDLVSLNRMLCSDCHQNNMDNYYEYAEKDGAINTFWGDASPFRILFQQLDLKNCIELACGRGRHVEKYVEKAGHITLVDILKRNIDMCKERFAGYDCISYYCNNGYDLAELKSDSYTSLFTYDSMVHFEAMDIYSYLRDIYRVLVPGGRALFHHSNFYENYRASFINAYNPHGRSFMSDRLFAHFADRAGFKVLEQKIINWGESQNLDCITLLEK